MSYYQYVSEFYRPLLKSSIWFCSKRLVYLQIVLYPNMKLKTLSKKQKYLLHILQLHRNHDKSLKTHWCQS
jgi:hypothetical protein